MNGKNWRVVCVDGKTGKTKRSEPMSEREAEYEVRRVGWLALKDMGGFWSQVRCRAERMRRKG